jgi:hypothetical protein
MFPQEREKVRYLGIPLSCVGLCGEGGEMKGSVKISAALSL